MLFCTAVNCMDGRVQTPVADFLRERFGVLYVDTVTEDGPVRALSGPDEADTAASILRRVALSIEEHGSEAVAVVAHGGCAGNPIDDETQLQQLAASVERIRETFPGVTALGLWVDDSWTVLVTGERGDG